MKTIEQAAKEANGYGYPNFNSPTNEAFNAGFKTGVEFAQRWIPIEEELPPLTSFDNYNLVLVKYISGTNDVKCCVATLQPISRTNFKDNPVDFTWFVFPSMGHKITVTHWRPIELK